MNEATQLHRLRMAWYRFKPRRWLVERCDHCGQRFGYREAHFANGNRDGKTFHEFCLGYLTWRRKATERLTVVGVMAELSGLTSKDVREVLAYRQPEGRSNDGWNLGWRVFYDLEKATTTEVASDAR